MAVRAGRALTRAGGRRATVARKTKETDIRLELNLDGRGRYQVETGIPFLNHMLELFTKHGFFDLTVRATGDLEVDYHHTVEDVGLALGLALRDALGEKAGIRRFGEASVPLDEALVTTVVDLSGRPFLVYDVRIKQAKIGSFDVELVNDFLLAMTNQAGMNLHVRMASGRNPHHIVEATFKSLARAILDNGKGNLRSVEKAFERLGHAAEVTRDPERIATAPGVVLPGVGAFGACMANLTLLGLVEPVRHAIRSGRPFLGICLGMQLLFEESEEFGPVAGLGILPGRVVRFTADPARKVPHMGWNALRMVRAAPALAGIDDGAYVYFVHSYYPVPADPAVVATTTPYGCDFASSVARDNVFACQFHPEKSQQVGLRLLDNFVRQLA